MPPVFYSSLQVHDIEDILVHAFATLDGDMSREAIPAEGDSVNTFEQYFKDIIFFLDCFSYRTVHHITSKHSPAFPDNTAEVRLNLRH